MTFEELYQEVITARAIGGEITLPPEELTEGQLDCLLHPTSYPLVLRQHACDCSDPACVSACIFQAMEVKDGNVVINSQNCVGCAECIRACKDENLTFSKDTVTAIDLLKSSESPVYALMAPAFVGQFGDNSSPAKIRTALKQIGFSGMVEVATFADILTLKEALEFRANVHDPENFQLTSCCCPVWIGMIRQNFSKIVSHLPASVSPMIACGRITKELTPGCKTVFIGPCMAKKAEARDPELAGAIDCVLTFQELADLFQVFQCDFSAMEEEVKEHASTAGRLYGRSGGVSKAVGDCVDTLSTDAKEIFQPVTANGVQNCKNLLEQILSGQIEGNFFEGMACEGGCAGGPKRNIDTAKCTELINQYAADAPFASPAENPYVADLMQELGFIKVADFAKNSDFLTRKL